MKTHFERNGFLHRQIQREGRIAIFERWKNNQLPHFEVVRIREHKAYQIAGVKFEAGEHYPSSSSWGIDGFTCVTKQRAEQRFNELVEREKEAAATNIPL